MSVGAGVPLSEECASEVISTTNMGPFWVFCFPLANYLVLFLTPAGTQDRPQCVCTSYGQDGFQSKALWEGFLDSLWTGTPSLSDPRGVSLRMCSQGLSHPKDGKYVTSWSFAQAGLSPSSDC